MSGPAIESTPPSSPQPPPVLAGSGPAPARAYAYVKERLLDGTFPGGALLSENELSQQLGLSRTPVRQAFVQLEAEGLLELYPKRGALVVPVAASEIEDVFEARLLVEEHCARRAASAGAPLAAQLAEEIADQERAIASGEPTSDFARSDRRFHRAIVGAAGNAILTRLYDALRDRQHRIAAPPPRAAARPRAAVPPGPPRAHPRRRAALRRRPPRARRRARARRRDRRLR